jgi:exopolysaccharide biosynthesis polyprenyl glycosylphosphotransferase
MNVTERLALSQGPLVYDEMASAVDDRTLEILDRRRKTATIRRRGWLIRRMLLLADVVGLTVAYVLAEILFGDATASGPKGELLAFLVTLPVWVVVAKLYGLYDRDEERTDHSTIDDFVGVFHLATIGAWLLFAGAWATGLADPHFAKLAAFWAFAITFVPTCRLAARAYSRRSLTYLQNTVIVGAGDVGQLVAHKLLQHPEYGINLVGLIDAEPKERRNDIGEVAILGPIERLAAIVRVFDIERVIIAFSNDSHEDVLELIRSLKDLDIQIDVVPRLFEILSPSVGIHTIEGLPVIGLPPLRLARSSKILKRCLDVVGAGLGLLVLAPFFAYAAIRIKRGSPGPVFFRQVRMGAGDKTFRIYKFRTMAEDADARKAEVAHLNKHAQNGGDPRMFKIANDPRVTRFGAFLRRYSLDELPQLINVFKGEMSFVGPRPLILDEDQYVYRWARKRLDLKPGITGLWQVLGRNEIPFSEMVNLDYIYVTTWSLWGDVRLLFQTLPLVTKGEDKSY